MFFSVSIALTFFSFSGLSVHSAPVVPRAMDTDVVALACTGVNGSSTCTPFNISHNDFTANGCTDVVNAKSLVLNPDNDCISSSTADCTNGGVRLHYVCPPLRHQWSDQ
ncbi:hypothetical protein B0H10DRAFT_2206369 [Mycena sp. CBHHK59/15]|nr:hypothetical protein B0H10DRAFT_2206369 [Mycena sp. CBHHK59/15]